MIANLARCTLHAARCGSLCVVGVVGYVECFCGSNEVFMALPPSSGVPGHGDEWPGPDQRNWTQTTLFDSTFLRSGSDTADLSADLLGVPLPARAVSVVDVSKRDTARSQTASLRSVRQSFVVISCRG